MAKKLGIFLAGGVIGAAVALLYAPRPGAETRAIVAEKANEAWSQAQELGAQAVVRGQEAYAGAVAQGQRVYDQAQDLGQAVYANVATASQAAGIHAAAVGKQAYEGARVGAHAAARRMQSAAENMRPVFSAKNDELRAKIDAARERIAAQVAKNAEAAYASMTGKAPIAAEGDTSAINSEWVEESAASQGDSIDRQNAPTGKRETE